VHTAVVQLKLNAVRRFVQNRMPTKKVVVRRSGQNVMHTNRVVFVGAAVGPTKNG